MADFNALETLINAYIKQNGVQAITGQVLNGVLRGMVSALGKGWTIAGDAEPTTDPGTMTGPVAYIAHTAGTYAHFGNLVVNDGEVAFLKYNEQTWTKEVLASLAATATVDANVGTPSVGVSFVNGVLTFDFRNMKGNPGINGTDGQDGAAAGFGVVNATVDGNVGTPGVSVSSSGPDTAKNFTFAFTNLKGETGVTSAVVTVDNTVGTPQCAVSLVGQELHLDFTGLKGAQGNPGSSVDYPFTLVNNLTTNDATQALTAAMGYQLESEITQLEHKVDDLQDETDVVVEQVRTPSVNLFDKTAVTPDKYVKQADGSLASSTTGWNASDYIDISGVSENSVYITGSAFSGQTGWAFYNASKVYTHGGFTYLASFQEGDVYFRVSVKAADLDTAMVTPGTSADVPGEYVPYGDTISYKMKANVVNTENIVDGANTASKIADDAITTPKIKDGNVTKAKVDFLTRTLHESKNLLNPEECVLGYVNKNTGAVATTITTRYATGFIPVDSAWLVSNAVNGYGSTGGIAVYDADKQYLRGDVSLSNLSFQTGDAYVRLTIKTDGLGESLYVVKGTDVPAYSPYIEPYYTYSLADDIIVPAPDNVPSYEPALSLAGKPGTKGTGDTIANDTIVLNDYPQYIKRCFNLSAVGKITAFEQLDLGTGKDTQNGTFLRVDATNIYFCRYYQGNPSVVYTQAHGLTISDFIDVSVYMDDGEMTARIGTFGGVFKHTFPKLVDMEAYGKPFVEVNANTSLTDFAFRAGGVRFRLPVWVVGDSYCSWYGVRWVKQLQTSFGVSDFLLSALAGGNSGTMYAELQKMLKFGTPKFLVWCLGMNDDFVNWNGTFLTLKALCESKGITLVLQTIPWPEDNPDGAAQKALINAEIKASGLRYFDGYAAVSSDANGTWYTGYCADGVHTTEEGAKAMAARFLVDFPEILQ